MESTNRKKLTLPIKCDFHCTDIRESHNSTCIELHHNRLSNMGRTGRTAFKPESKVWLPLNRVSRNSPLDDGFL
jgi:hypothetical protein